MRIFLDIDSETIARLDAIGTGGTTGQSAEILGMALLEAYQMKRAREKVARKLRRK